MITSISFPDDAIFQKKETFYVTYSYDKYLHHTLQELITSEIPLIKDDKTVGAVRIINIVYTIPYVQVTYRVIRVKENYK